MRFPFTLLVLFFLVSGKAGASAETPEEFFKRFVETGQRFDPAVADLYADHASIKAYRRYPHGLERSMEMSGVEWKALVRKVMPLARSKNDKSTYTNVKFAPLGNRVKISADRYAVRKCYTDPAYYLVIEKRTDSTYTVIEEYLETEPRPDC